MKTTMGEIDRGPVLARRGTFVIRPHPDTLPANPGPPGAFDDDLAPEDWVDTLA